MKVVVVFACCCDDGINLSELNDALQEVAGENGGKCPHIEQIDANVEKNSADQICAVVANRELSESELEMIREDFRKNRYHTQNLGGARVFRVEIPDASPIA